MTYRHDMSQTIEAIRDRNVSPKTFVKSATELANEGNRCGNCSYFSPLKTGRCVLKDKHVSSFNICERWTNVP